MNEITNEVHVEKRLIEKGHGENSGEHWRGQQRNQRQQTMPEAFREVGEN